MPDLTPRMILDAIHEGLEESALLVAQGYDPSQGRPRPYPDEWNPSHLRRHYWAAKCPHR